MPTRDRPIAFAHRGGSALWPENTLLAFRGAIELGIRELETDVHLSRDGKVVVFHDRRLERTTDGFGLLQNFDWAELRKLDAGYRFSPDGKTFPWRGKGVRIPLFEELAELDPEVRFNVELKARGAGLERAFLALIERKKLCDRVRVAAADHRIVTEFRALAGRRVRTSASAREVLSFWLAVKARATRLLPIAYDALQVPPRQGRLRVIDRAFVERAHARGIEVHAWTIDEPAEMHRLLALGVDGLMSDRPDVLLRELAESQSKIGRSVPSRHRARFSAPR
jgi:glycerophosphoryl diester phosphodiesterase